MIVYEIYSDTDGETVVFVSNKAQVRSQVAYHKAAGEKVLARRYVIVTKSDLLKLLQKFGAVR